MSGTYEGARWSWRAQILARILDWVNEDRYEDYDSWMLFGNMGADVSGDLKVLFEKGNPEDESLHQASADLHVAVGELFDARRTSLHRRAPKIKVRNMEELSRREPDPGWRARPEPERSEVAEFLDAKYASEVIGKLEKIVRNAALLDPHKVDTSRIYDNGMRAYFQEAHRCYLFGFNAACAIMCRALLESALKVNIDPDRRIEDNLPKGQSLFNRLLELSKLEEPLRSWAKDVRKSGDYAVHDYHRFQKDYESQGKMEEILSGTREVLAALYPAASDPG